MENLDLAAGIVGGIDNAFRNFQTSLSAVQQAKTTAQKNALEMKKADLDIKKMELELDPDTVAQNKELLAAKVKAQKAQDAWHVARTTREMRKAKQEALQHKTAMDFFQTVVNDPTKRNYVGVSGDGKMTYTPPKVANVNYNMGGGGSAAGGSQIVGTGSKEKARAYLTENGLDDSDTSIELLMKNNPGAF